MLIRPKRINQHHRIAEINNNTINNSFNSIKRVEISHIQVGDRIVGLHSSLGKIYDQIRVLPIGSELFGNFSYILDLSKNYYSNYILMDITDKRCIDENIGLLAGADILKSQVYYNYQGTRSVSLGKYFAIEANIANIRYPTTSYTKKSIECNENGTSIRFADHYYNSYGIYNDNNTPLLNTDIGERDYSGTEFNRYVLTSDKNDVNLKFVSNSTEGINEFNLKDLVQGRRSSGIVIQSDTPILYKPFLIIKDKYIQI